MATLNLMKYQTEITLDNVTSELTANQLSKHDITMIQLNWCDNIHIYPHVFEDFINLTAIQGNVWGNLYIDDYAFKNTGLTKNPFQTVAHLGKSVFENCSNITNITFNYENNSPLLLDDKLCYNCEKLTTFNVWTSSEIILKNSVFYNCKNLTTTNFTYLTILSVPDRCFYNCHMLSHINFSHIQSIGNYSFDGCENFPPSIYIPQCKSIGRYAFRGCKNLETLIAPKCTFVDYNAFYDTKLWNVEPS